MTKPTARVRVTEFTVDAQRAREDRVIGEEPLEVRLVWPGQASSQRVWVTMRTPGHDFELAAGYLVAEGFAIGTDVQAVAYCTDADLTADQRFNVVTARLAVPPRRTLTANAGVGAGSACGVCGADSINDVLERAFDVREPADLDPAVARELPRALRAQQELFSTTGGVHAAGVSTLSGRLLVVREDVGRHNAVDKAIGAVSLAQQTVSDPVLVVSGRAGYELVAKAAVINAAALVSVGAPTSLAVRVARAAGVGLFGFTSAERTVRYA